ncbi:NAD(P)-binding domain-containing protein [Flavobacteriaceae bacterium]|nr:NAD(P)-binding domain-containing protein [Flavobacteriaceae bacterium]
MANTSYLKNETKEYREKISLSNIVQVQSVREGLKNGIYKDYRPFIEFYEDGVIWSDGSKEAFDEVIWCTGFGPNLKYLQSLGITEENKIKTRNTQSLREPGLWLVGYGNWTGFASATIYGVGKTAKQTAEEIKEFLS